jgi:hypothetical protein
MQVSANSAPQPLRPIGSVANDLVRSPSAAPLSPLESSSQAFESSIDLEGLSADSLLDFLSLRLDDIDGRVSKEIRAIEGQGHDSNAISQRRELLDQIASAVRLETTDPKKEIKLSSLEVTWNGATMFAHEAINAAGLQADVAFTATVGGTRDAGRSSKVTLENVESASSKLEKEQKRLTSDNDLRMLRLQDMMNRRSQLVQMVSNFMRSIQDSQRAIVGNMR